MVLLPTFFKPGQKLTVRSFLAQGPKGVISFGTQGSDLTSFSFIPSPMTWHLCFILEGSEEPSVEETSSSSVSEDGGEHPLGVEKCPHLFSGFSRAVPLGWSHCLYPPVEFFIYDRSPQ